MKLLTIIMLAALPLLAQVPRKEVFLQIVERPSSRVARQEFSAGTHVIFNTSGARRLSSSSGGGISTSYGIFETYTGSAGSEVLRNRLDNIGVRTTGAVRVENPTGGAAGYFEFFNDPAGTVAVSVRAPNNMAEGCMYHDGAGVASWQPCAVGDFVTLDTSQTITGAKIFKGSLTIEDTLSGVDRVTLGAGSLSLRTTGDHGRVLLSSSSAIDGSTGIVRVTTGPAGLESTVAEMAAGGVNVNSPAAYRFNGTSGATAFCSPGQYPNSLNLQGGLVLGVTCTTLPSSGGDMLLGTTQTVTARKDFQMSFGGDAIRINNSFGSTKGFLNDAQWYFGDSSGRGVAINNSGVQITNTSGIQVFSISTTGTLNVWDSALGTVRNGLTITCAVGQTVRQPVHVQGILMSGGCGI